MFGSKRRAQRERELEEAHQRRQEEYRRAHLWGVARFAALTGQSGPTCRGGGTVVATQEEMDRLLGKGWRERATSEMTGPRGVAGTAVWHG